MINWLENKFAEGIVNHICFSFHDEYPVFEGIIYDYDNWDFCQIQYNYIDSDFQAGTKGLEYVASKGLSVIIMEPIAGGKLAMIPPHDIVDLWKMAEVKRTPVAWALRWYGTTLPFQSFSAA